MTRRFRSIDPGMYEICHYTACPEVFLVQVLQSPLHLHVVST